MKNNASAADSLRAALRSDWGSAAVSASFAGASASGCPATAKSYRLNRMGSVASSLKVRDKEPLAMSTASLSTPSAMRSTNCGG